MSVLAAIFAGLVLSALAKAQKPCADVFQYLNSNNDPSQLTGRAVYECLTSVPFNQTNAKGFLSKYRSTLEFHSTLAWLKNPPSSYKQPATDIMGGLDGISAAVDNGTFTNEYDFEAAILYLLHSAHDGHLFLNAGATGSFAFYLPLNLTSISADGVSLPKPYSFSDVDLAASGSSNLSWSPSAMETINGQDAVQWLTGYASKYAKGYLEPNVDYNNLFFSGSSSASGVILATTFNSLYPGEWFNVTFENGTEYSDRIKASFRGELGPTISSGEEFYAYYVAEASATPSAASASAGGSPNAAADEAPATTKPQTQTASWRQVKDITAYPSNPDVVQPNLGQGGYLTGYFYAEQSLAVLSLPSFEMTGSDARSFSASMNEFITKAKAKGLQKVLIDVQGNVGGDALLSTELFKNFFPTIDPFSGSRMRAHETANVLGDAFTSVYLNASVPPEDRNSIIFYPWTAPPFLNAATNQSFASWEELSQNYTQNGDLFSITLRDNLTNAIFDLEATGGDGGNGIVVDGYANRTNEPPQPYAASDIAILMDGMCISTCTTFGELFHHEAGVKIIVAGGRPEYGPMQGIGSVRGANSYSQASLNDDIHSAVSWYPELKGKLPGTKEYLNIQTASFNLRDQIRKNESFPLEFAYLPADCRIFYTAETFNNYTNLWKYAANVMWGNGTCVQGSTGQSESYGNATSVSGVNGTAGGSGAQPTGSGSPSPTSSGAGPGLTGAASMNGVSSLALVLAASIVVIL